MQSFEHYLEAICISADDMKNSYDISGKINCDNYTLYDADMDEYCNVFDKKEKISDLHIKLVEDEELIKDINFLIRTSIRNLNSVYMFYYNSLKNHRRGNLKELINDLKYLYKECDNIVISLDTINDLEIYLKTLEPKTTIEEDQSNKKAKSKVLKKKRKR